jgi:CHAD domain-containing protein
MSHPALEVVVTAVRRQLDDIVALESAVREDRPEAVHDMRTAVRRLRTTLAASRPVLDREITDGLRERLGELGAALEPARDAEVRGELAASLPVSGDGDEELLRARLVDDSHAEYDRDRRALVAVLDRPEHAALLRDLEELVHRPPLGPEAHRRQSSVLHAALRREARRAHRRLAAVVAQDLDSMHDARRAVRRVRYLAEAMVQYAPHNGGAGVAELGRAARQLQEVLGDHRDAVLHARWIADRAVASERAGENPEAYRRLERIERDRAEALVVDRTARTDEFEERRRALG